MWIKFPSGAESLSVEQQSFVSEYEVDVPDEKEGKRHENWFRVPNHFVPTILGLNLGYSALQLGETPPGCHMEDLAASDPKRDDKLGSLAIQLDSQTKTNVSLTRALERSEEQRKQAETECFILRNRLKDLEEELEDLKSGVEKIPEPAIDLKK